MAFILIVVTDSVTILLFTLFLNFSDEDEDFKKQVQQLRDSMPFAVVGANTMVEIKGKKLRGRQYPWGIVEVENPTHCDFVKLRTMLITHMQDLQVMMRLCTLSC